MRIASRFVNFLAGASALYVVLAPRLSDLPNLQPVWVTAALWSGAILLLVASLIARDFGSRLAAVGSCIILARYCCLAVLLILVQLGYYHFETRLVASHEAPRWRYTLDKPILILLLVSALVSLGLALRSLVRQRPVPSDKQFSVSRSKS